MQALIGAVLGAASRLTAEEARDIALAVLGVLTGSSVPPPPPRAPGFAPQVDALRAELLGAIDRLEPAAAERALRLALLNLPSPPPVAYAPAFGPQLDALRAELEAEAEEGAPAPGAGPLTPREGGSR
jgi:hypothetical protein